MGSELKYLSSGDYDRILYALANKFAGEQESTKNIARETLGYIGSVRFEPRADHTWDSILSLADEQDKILLLLDNAIKEAGGSVQLEQLKKELETIRLSLNYTTVRPIETAMPQPGLPEILMVYSDEDAVDYKELKKHFKIMEREQLLVLRDFQSLPEENKTEQEEKLLASARMVLFLLSPGFFAGEYVEHARKLAGQDKPMIPVLLKSCLWKRVKVLAGRLPVPRDEQFISGYSIKDKGYMEVAEAVMSILDQQKKDNE